MRFARGPMRPVTGPERVVKSDAFSYFLLFAYHLGSPPPASAVRVGCLRHLHSVWLWFVPQPLCVIAVRMPNHISPDGKRKLLILHSSRAGHDVVGYVLQTKRLMTTTYRLIVTRSG